MLKYHKHVFNLIFQQTTYQIKYQKVKISVIKKNFWMLRKNKNCLNIIFYKEK